MFSLIITLIAIALVAALALATLYYGGPIFNEGADRAQAAKIEAQGQQIMGAMELYHAEKGVYPAALADLVTDEYLRSIPTAAAQQAQLVASALAATGTWSLISPGQPVIVMKPVSVATCKAFNLSNTGTAGVLQQAHSTKLKQCVGTNVNNLMIVQPKAVADLLYVAADAGAAVQIGNVLATPIPALSDTTLNGWLNTLAPASAYSVGYSVASLTFANTQVDTASAPQTVVVTNTGTSALTITGAAAAAPFSVTGTDCAAIAPGATCSVDVVFTPTLAQPYNGAGYNLTLTSSAATLSVLPLTGTGVPATGSNVVAYSMSVGGAPLNGLLVMAPTAANMSHPGYFIEVTNITNGPVEFDNGPMGSVASADAPLVVVGDYCAGVTLAPAESCTMELQMYVPGGTPGTTEGGVGSYVSNLVMSSVNVPNINPLTVQATFTVNAEY